MKIRCAWCNELIGYKCLHCGEPLKLEKHKDGVVRLVCESQLAKIIYLDTVSMQETHGMCEECRAEKQTKPRPLTPLEIIERAEQAALTDEDRANAEAELVDLYKPEETKGGEG